jgi:hypothetical protein
MADFVDRAFCFVIITEAGRTPHCECWVDYVMRRDCIAACHTVALIFVTGLPQEPFMKSSMPHDLLRLFYFVFGLFGIVLLVSAIRDKRVDVPVDKNGNIAVSQVSDPVVYWGLVTFIALMTAALLFCAIFAKEKRKG